MVNRFLKLLVKSLGIIGIVAVLGLVFGLITQRRFDVGYMFAANFLVGVLIVAAGVFYMFVPSSMLQKGDKLFDHTTFVERSYNARKRRQEVAMKMLSVGIMNVLITGLIEIILHIII